MFLVALASCRDHTDIEENYYNTAVQRLVKTFHEKYGIPDNNHVWSTLGQLDFSISLPEGNMPYSVSLYTSNPQEITPRSFRFAQFGSLECGQIHHLRAEASRALQEVYVEVYDHETGLCHIEKVERDSQGRFTLQVDEVSTPVPSLYYSDMQFLLAFEDLGIAVDLDYNDFILGIRHVVGRDEMELRIMALGTNLNVWVYFDGKELFDGKEIHQLLQTVNSTYVNVFSDKNVFPLENRVNSQFNISSHPEIIVKYKVAEDFSVEEMVKHISIKTAKPLDKNEDKEVKEIFFGRDLGKAPLALLIADGNWEWPSEGVDIGTAYPDFINWVADQDHYNWY